MAQIGSFVATKKVLWRHGSYLCRPALVVACNFLSRHIFMLSSLILSRHILTLSQHSSVDDMVVFCRDKVSLNSRICCRDRLFLYHERVVLPYIAKTKLCVATDSFHVVT